MPLCSELIVLVFLIFIVLFALCELIIPVITAGWMIPSLLNEVDFVKSTAPLFYYSTVALVTLCFLIFAVMIAQVIFPYRKPIQMMRLFVFVLLTIACIVVLVVSGDNWCNLWESKSLTNWDSFTARQSFEVAHSCIGVHSESNCTMHVHSIIDSAKSRSRGIIAPVSLFWTISALYIAFTFIVIIIRNKLVKSRSKKTF